MNYITLAIRLIGKPEYKHTENSIPFIEMLGKFYQPYNSNFTFCKVLVWGNLAGDLMKYYTHNDYLFVEGYVSLKGQFIEDLKTKIDIEVVAYKLYPYALKSINTNNNFFFN